MASVPTYPTPHLEANAVLDLLLNGVREVLGEQFLGLYLYGSLSSGDFDPCSSDIDFLVVTEGELAEERVAALGAVHGRIAASGLRLATHLEGSYLPRSAIRRWRPGGRQYPTIGVDWEFGLGEHDSTWVLQLAVVREGVAVAGPPPRTLIDPVSEGTLRDAVRTILREIWVERAEDREWLAPRLYQAFAVLTMCRALQTLETGELASKPAAAAWARRALGSEWSETIDRALTQRDDYTPDNPSEAQRFIRHVLERAHGSGSDAVCGGAAETLTPRPSPVRGRGETKEDKGLRAISRRA